MLLSKTYHHMLLILTLPIGFWYGDAVASELDPPAQSRAYTSWLTEISWKPRNPKLDDYKNPYIEKAKTFAKQLTNTSSYHKNLKKIASKWQNEAMPDTQAMLGWGIRPSTYDPSNDMLKSFQSHTEDLVITHSGLKDLTKGFSFSFNPKSWFTSSEPTVPKRKMVTYTSQLIEITPDFSGPATAAVNSDPLTLLPHAAKAKLKWQLVPKKQKSRSGKKKPIEKAKVPIRTDYAVSNLWDAMRYQSLDMTFLSMDFTGDIKSEGPLDPRKQIPNQTLRLKQEGGLYEMELTADGKNLKPSAIHTLSAPLTQIFRYESKLNNDLDLVKYGLLAHARRESTYATSVYNRVKEKLWELNFSQTANSRKLNFRITVPNHILKNQDKVTDHSEKIELSFEKSL